MRRVDSNAGKAHVRIGQLCCFNISGDTYTLVKEQFKCTYRGKVEAKNKGEVDMYFVEAVSNITL